MEIKSSLGVVHKRKRRLNTAGGMTGKMCLNVRKQSPESTEMMEDTGENSKHPVGHISRAHVK